MLKRLTETSSNQERPMKTKPMDTLLKLMTQYFMELCSIYVQHLEKIFNVLMMKTVMKDSSIQTTFRDVKKVRSY